jgi:ribosomal protein S18 acetylase RimI-like enzyme
MEGFSWRWNVPAAGILDLTVAESYRRQGLGRFFLAHIIRYLQEQYFGVCECQIGAGNDSGPGLLHSLGFEPVDRGAVYRKAGAASAAVPA